MSLFLALPHLAQPHPLPHLQPLEKNNAVLRNCKSSLTTKVEDVQAYF